MWVMRGSIIQNLKEQFWMLANSYYGIVSTPAERYMTLQNSKSDCHCFVRNFSRSKIQSLLFLGKVPLQISCSCTFECLRCQTTSYCRRYYWRNSQKEYKECFVRNGGKRKIFFSWKPFSIYGLALDVSKSTDDVKKYRREKTEKLRCKIYPEIACFFSAKWHLLQTLKINAPCK